MKSRMTESAPQETSDPAAEAEMAKYGITRVPVDYFHYKGFRYTNLNNAIAQAMRDEDAA